MTGRKLRKALRSNSHLADNVYNGCYRNKWISGGCFTLAQAFQQYFDDDNGRYLWVLDKWNSPWHVVYYRDGWCYDGFGINRKQGMLNKCRAISASKFHLVETNDDIMADVASNWFPVDVETVHKLVSILDIVQ